MANKSWNIESIEFFDDEHHCVHYTEEEYKHDLKRYFELNDWFEKKERKRGEEFYICNANITDCKNCVFYGIVPKHQLCSDFAYESFDTIKKIFVWAREHPEVTNEKKLIEVFGEGIESLIKKIMYDENPISRERIKLKLGLNWLSEEYKKTK